MPDTTHQQSPSTGTHQQSPSTGHTAGTAGQHEPTTAGQAAGTTGQDEQTAPADGARRTHRRRWVLGAGAALVAAAAGGVALLGGRGGSPATPPAASPNAQWTPRTPVPPADLNTRWVGVQTHDVSAATAFGDWLGRPLDCVVVFNSDADWPAVSGPWFAMAPPQGQDWGAWVREDPSRTLVVSTGMVPADPPQDWRARGAAGEYDQHWVTFGKNLVEKGLGSSILRLGWELNGAWYATHYIGDTAELREQWKAYFRRIVEAVEVEGSSFEIDFNIAEGQNDSVTIAEMYPGDDWVDIVGVDVYDSYISPVDPTSRWEQKDAKVNSLSDVIAFAAEHGKPVSLPEWAMVAEGSTQGGGDSPQFIDQIADALLTTNVRYQAYFNQAAGGVGMTLDDAPQGRQAFLDRFGASGDAGPTGV